MAKKAKRARKSNKPQSRVVFLIAAAALVIFSLFLYTEHQKGVLGTTTTMLPGGDGPINTSTLAKPHVTHLKLHEPYHCFSKTFVYVPIQWDKIPATNYWVKRKLDSSNTWVGPGWAGGNAWGENFHLGSSGKAKIYWVVYAAGPNVSNTPAQLTTSIDCSKFKK